MTTFQGVFGTDMFVEHGVSGVYFPIGCVIGYPFDIHLGWYHLEDSIITPPSNTWPNSINTTFVNTKPMSLRAETFSNCNMLTAFSDFFYHKILVEPVVIDFGNLVNQQVRTITVWNGYLHNVTLDTIVKNNFDTGTVLDGDTPPSLFYALQDRTYSLILEVGGPPNIDANFVFDFASPTEDVLVSFTGSRVVLLPIVFKDRVTETIEWKTEVLSSRNGTEQRIKLRTNARHILNISAYLNFTDRQYIENLLFGWRQRIWSVPMWIEARKLSSPISIGDNTVSVDTRWGDFRINGTAVVWHSNRIYDVFIINTIADFELGLNRTFTKDFPAGSWVMPTRSGIMKKDPKRMTTGFDGRLDATIRIQDNLEVENEASPVQFNTHDFYDMVPLYDGDSGVVDEYMYNLETLDFGNGVEDYFTPWDNMKIGRSFDLILEGLQQIWEHRQWLCRRAGRLRPYYTPTYEVNFIIKSVGVIGTTIKVADDGYMSQSQVRNHIVIRKKDTTLLFRTIVDVSQFDDTTLTIEMDTAINIDVTVIDEINFIGLKRLSSDRIKFDWRQNNTVITQVPMLEIEQ
jgi:hypothetical protein